MCRKIGHNKRVILIFTLIIMHGRYASGHQFTVLYEYRTAWSGRRISRLIAINSLSENKYALC
jgi:hypothetical protein